MGVKLGLSHWETNVCWGCLRIWCWGEYLGLRGTGWQGNGENYIMRSLMISTLYEILFGWSDQELDGRGMWHVWWTGQVNTLFWLEAQRKGPPGRHRRKWEDNINMNVKSVGVCRLDWSGWVKGQELTLVNGTMNLGIKRGEFFDELGNC